MFIIILLIVFIFVCIIGYLFSLFVPNNKSLKENEVPIDISRMRIKTKEGLVEITTNDKQRQAMRKQLKDRKVIETKKVKYEDNLKWIDDIEEYEAMDD